MAKKEQAPKIVLERTYNVPLRRKWLLSPKHRRAKKAIRTLKEFLVKHMKPSKDEKGRLNLKIGMYLNEFMWKHGMKNPPHHIKIVAKKDEKGNVTADLEGAPAPKVEEKKPAKKESLAAKVDDKKESKAEPVKAEAKKEEVKPAKEAKAPKKKAAEPKAPAPSNIEQDE